MDSVHGVTCIKGEIHSIMTLMRLSTRWSHAKHQVDVTIYQDENPLVKSFRRLNEYLEGMFDLNEVDCVMYIAPFHQVIVSDQASGPLTSAALSSLSKFVLYGFLKPKYPRVGEGIGLIAACIENCKFEETDWESDEVILMKLLELSALVFRCEAANLLTVGAVWDIYSTCISIHSQRASKILRSEAESTLRHLTLTAFSKIKFSLSNHSNISLDRNSTNDANLDVKKNDDVNAFSSGEFKDKSWDIICKQMDFASSIGLTMLLAKIMSVLSTLMDLQSNSIEEVKFSLSLVNIALEAGGPALSFMGPLVDVLRGDVCRHLLRASQSEDLAIFSLALRVVFNLFMSIKDHMKVQLEVFFSSVHLRLLQSNGQLNNQQVAGLSAREELALESLLEFCREPSLMYDLYTNYDCDVQCTNLFDSIITTLCTRAVPTIYLSCTKNDSIKQEEPLNDIVGMVYAQNERHSKVNILNKLALDGVFAVLHTVAVRCSNVEVDVKQESSQSLLQSSSQNSLNQTENLLPTGVLRYAGREILENPPLEMIEMQIDQWCSTSEPGTPPLNDALANSDGKINDKEIQGLAELRYSNSVSPAPISESINAMLTEGASALPNSNSNSNMGNSSEDPDFVFLARSQTSDLLRERKLKKQMLRLVTEKFNESPFKTEWIKLALDLDLLQAYASQSASNANPNSILSIKVGKNMEDSAVEAKNIAKFLKLTPGLGKSQIGEYLSKGPKDKYPFHAEVLKEYVGTFDFSEKSSNNKVSFVNALRNFLGHFRLPGEAQCIDRLMEAFAVRLYEYLGYGNPFKNSDAAFVLAFSTIMLNTDLHSHQIQHNKRMTKEQFINNNRKINDNEDLPRVYLESLYDEIKSKQLQVDLDINDTGITGAGSGLIDFTDTATWNKLLRKSAMDQAPAAFTPTVAARRLTSSGGGHKSQYALPLSIHEKDMFLVMAKPVLETMIIIWEISDDDRIIRRILEGIWDYAAVCVGLNLAQLLGEMISLLSLRARVILTLSRHKVSNETHAQSRNYSIIDMELRKLLQSSSGCDMISLVNADFYSLITSNRSSSSFNTSAESYNWTGANIIKGELMIKAIFYITNKFTSYLDHDSWLSVYKLLLWVRGRGLLPRSLATITEISQYLSMDIDKNRSGSNLEVSLYALKCIENAKNKKYKRTHNQKQSWWSSLIFGSADSGASSREHQKDKLHQAVDVDGNAGIYKLDPKYNQEVGNGNGNATKSKIVSGDEYLRNCLLHSKVDLGMFQLSFRWEDGFLNMSVISIITLLSDILSSIVAETTEQRDTDESEDILFLKFQFQGIEMDAVVLLEWLSHICVSNRHRIYIIWPKVHNFLVEISEEKLEDLYSCCPYFLERCVILILRSINTTIEYTGGNISDASDAHNVSKNSETIVLDTLNSMWSSLRLLRGFPSQLLNNIADRLAVGVLSLMQCYRSILFKADGVTDTAVQEYFGIEQWYMVFSLLSGATCSHVGRPFVWDTICYIIDNNLVSDVNYSPCRQLVLRFIHGVFLGEEEEKESIEYDEMDESSNNPWKSTSMMYLVRLTSMVLGGYVLLNDNNDLTEPNYNGSTPTKACDNKIVTFSLPPIEKKLYNILSPILEIKNLPKITESNNSKFLQSTSMEVAVVAFKSVKEIETLWLETCKTFANMVNTANIRVAYRALYCIQAVFLAGETVGLSDSSWFEVLQELVNILPINFASVAALRDNSVDPKLKYELLEICLRSCNLMFEMIVTYLNHLRNVSEFPSIWLRFVSVLANNVNVVQKNAALHEEVLEMIVALLRLLHPPALPSSVREAVNSPTLSKSNSTSQNSFLGLLASAIFDEPKQEQPLSPLTVISPNIHNKTPLSGGGVTGDEFDDAALLALTWTNISTICASLVPSLKVKNGQLVNDMLKYIEQFENSRVVTKNDDAISIASASNTSEGDHHVSAPKNSIGKTLIV